MKSQIIPFHYSNNSNASVKLFNINFYKFLFIIAINLFSTSVFEQFALVIPPITFILLLRNDKLEEAFVFYLVCLFLSDSAIPVFFSTGNSSKDIITLMLGFFLIQRNFNSGFLFLKYIIPFLIVAIYTTLLSNLNYLIPFQKILSYAIVCFTVGSFWFYTHSRGKAIEAITLIISVFTFFMIWGMLNVIIENTDYMKFDGRFNGIQRNPNGVGIFASMMITLIYIANKTYQVIKPTKMWLIILVFLIAILLSGSRNGLVTVVIFFSFINLKLNFWKSLIVGSIILGTYDYIFSNIMTLISSFNLNDELRLQTLENASGRIYIWQAAWLEIQNYFWIGGGFTYDMQGQIWLQKYFQSIPQLIENYGNIHSSYLTLWLNTGILGLALFYIGIGALYYKASLKSHIVSAALFSFLFLGIYESWMTASLNPFTWIFWTVPSLVIMKD